ncbi:hypothetical protein GCM10028773_59940 [Spirosoma koreense]
MPFRGQAQVKNLPLPGQAQSAISQLNGQVQASANRSLAGQYIVVYKPTSTVQARVMAVQPYPQRQQLMRNEATATLAKNRLVGKPVLHVYDTALKGFAVSGLTGADVEQLRRDDQIDYVVADQPVFGSEYGAPAPLAASCNGPSITLNGVTNYNVGLATFGSTAAVSGQVVLAIDGATPFNDACTAIQNNVSGKIALIDRGSCDFITKATVAQQAGAIGVIIVNNAAGDAPGMSGTSSVVTIPVMSLSQADGNALKTTLNAGTIVTAILDRQLPDNNSQCKPWGIARVGGGGSGVGKRAWIIDSGIDLTHPDLNVNTALSTYFVGTSPADGNGHGTHVAGTIAAKDNGFGVVGVAAGAEVVAVKVLADDNGSVGSSIIAGVNYVAAHAASADVANMSLGGPPNKALDDAVLALSNVCKVVVAAGNNAQNTNYYSPARVNAPNILTVSAMDIYDKLASFSNFGNGPVDYSAPGVNIASCWPGGGYAYLNGTSMAAPHVSGLLLLGTICGISKITGDKDNVPDLIASLYNAANDVDNDHDGYTVCAGDCDDSDPTVHPGAAELCDNKDNNCNGQIDEGNVCCPGGTTLYVNASASGANTGVSWANAFTSLQAALTAAKRCSQITQIWVAKGTYYPGIDALGQTAPLDPRTKSFVMQNNLAIYGGFIGNEANLSQRNPGQNTTTLSGDIQQDGQIANNAYHVIQNIPEYGSSLNSTAILDGFIVRDGFANFVLTSGTTSSVSYPDSYGGGLINYNANPTIRNCIMFNNGAYYGGGLADNFASPALINNLFVANAGSFDGGAIINELSSSPTLINCAILQNSARHGGGIENNNSSNPALTNCSFSGNNASVAGGGMYNYDGSAPVVKNSIFWGDGTEVTNEPASATIAASNPTITYSIIQGGWTGSGANNLNADPKFTSQPTYGQNTIGDLSLTNCSPAVNAGDPATTTAMAGAGDLNGNPRIIAGRVDIGAYEVVSPNFPVVVLTQPTASSVVCEGGTITASVSVSGTISGYQWYKNDLSSPVAGQTLATLSIPAATTADAGSYSVVVTGACNAITSTAFSLTVACTDLSPQVTARPSTIRGTNNVFLVVDVYELNSLPTTAPITVKVAKDPKVTFSFDNSLTSVGGKTVQNSAWSISGPTGGYYSLTTNQTIAAGATLSFGLNGVLTPGSTTGVLTASATLLGGGEVELGNNTDADKIEYFQQ